jgi:DDE superfamily endonuclease
VSDAPDQQTNPGGAHVPPVWQDGTERPIHRPADPEDQQEYDSGTKTCHTIKNLLVIDETCQIGFLRATDDGKANDKVLAEVEG